MYQRFTLLGVNLDIDPIDLPPDVWSEAANMVPRPGRMERAKGWVPVFPDEGELKLDIAAYWMLFSPQLGQPHWVYAGYQQLNDRDMIANVDELGRHSDITPAAGIQKVGRDGWSGGNLNGLAIINSFENPPLYWFDGIGSEALELPGLRPQARYKVMRPFKYHLIGMGASEGGAFYGDQLHWSDAADPGQIPQTWVPTAENEAGDNILSDEDGDIVDGLALRDSFFIYKQDSIYEMTYVGGVAVFRFRKVFGTTGVLCKNCVVRVKGTHVVLGNGDIYRHDGQNMTSIVDGKLRDTFFRAIDNENFRNSYVVYLEREEEVWFCVPGQGQVIPNIALVWNVTTNNFGYREMPDTDFAATGVITDTSSGDDEQWDNKTVAWDSTTSGWSDVVFSDAEDSLLLSAHSNFYRGNTGNIGYDKTGNPVDYTSSVSRLGLDMGHPRQDKAIRRIWPRVNAPEGITWTLELFNQRDPGGNPVQVMSRTFDHMPNEGIPVNVNARYLGVRLSTPDSLAWDIQGFDVEYRPRGHF